MQKIGFTLMEQAGQALPDNTPVKEPLAAFTLIELLVVVLIVGILAAIAVPQYQKTVLKSRFTTVMPMAKAVADAQEVYYLGNGEYATQLPSLDIAKPAGDNSGVLVGLKNTARYDYVLATRDGLNNNYIIYQDHSPNFPQNIHCEAKSDDTQANWVCESLGGTQMDGSQTQNYTTYILQGSEEDGRLPTTYTNTSGITLYEGDVCIAYSNSSGDSSCVNTYKDGAKCDAQGNWKCNGTVFENGSVCNAQGQAACRGTFDNSTCYSHNMYSCEGTFTNDSKCVAIAMNQSCRGSSFVDSTCKAGTYNSCRGSSFKNSECLGNNGNTCGGVYGDKSTSFDNSTCYGNQSNSCSSAPYTNNSICIMNHSEACQGNTYSNGGGCQNGTNGTCPAGTPQPGGWDAATETYTPAGWNGGYCNPSAMTSGKCPAGSPTSTSGTCWDGDGNEITC